MTARLAAPDWYDRVELGDSEREAVDEAKCKILEKAKAVTPGRVVAELTFGFWVKLLAWPYEKSLWTQHLHRIFPLKAKRQTLHGRLVELKTLRNRIAHHERIIGKQRSNPDGTPRSLMDDYQDTLEVLGWLNIDMANWVKHTNCFESRCARKIPKRRPPAEAKPEAPATSKPSG